MSFSHSKIQLEIAFSCPVSLVFSNIGQFPDLSLSFMTLTLWRVVVWYFGEGNGTLLQHSCLENPMDRRAWWAAVHGVTRSRTWLSDFTFTFHFHALEKEMATHSTVLAWRIPGTGEPGGLPSMGSHRVGHDWSDLAAAAAAAAWYFVDFPQFVSCFPWNYTLWGNHHINDDII